MKPPVDQPNTANNFPNIRLPSMSAFTFSFPKSRHMKALGHALRNYTETIEGDMNYEQNNQPNKGGSSHAD